MTDQCKTCNGDRFVSGAYPNLPDEPCPVCNPTAPSGAERVRAFAAGTLRAPTTPVLELGVPVVLAFSHQRIADMVTTAIESPVGDWLKRAVTARAGIDSKPLDNHFPWYSQGAYWAQSTAGLGCTVDKPTDAHSGKKLLSLEDFQRALILMATKDEGAYSHHFAGFLRGNEDALTADLFMQFAVYGDEVFA